MIPKVIHYCWFGRKPLPELVKQCIESWKKYCPDYEIVQWNEENVDLECCDYVKEAYDAKKWAFVSDYVRLMIIYKYGGIYLDTDVELVNSLDNLILHKCFLGTESTGNINTGVGFGAEKENRIIKLLLEEYKNQHFYTKKNGYDKTPCPVRNTRAIKKIGYTPNKKNVWKVEDVAVFPEEYFSPINYETGISNITKNTISIHHYAASWHNQSEEKKIKILRWCISSFGEKKGKKIADILSIPYRIKLKFEKILNKN